MCVCVIVCVCVCVCVCSSQSLAAHACTAYRLTVSGLLQACATTALYPGANATLSGQEWEATDPIGDQVRSIEVGMHQEKSTRFEVTGCTAPVPAPAEASASERVAPAVVMAFAALFAN